MLHAKKGEDFLQREMLEIREQLALEHAQRTNASWVELFTLRYAKRLLLACFILNMTKLSGGKFRTMSVCSYNVSTDETYRRRNPELSVSVLCWSWVRRKNSPPDQWLLWLHGCHWSGY